MVRCYGKLVSCNKSRLTKGKYFAGYMLACIIFLSLLWVDFIPRLFKGKSFGFLSKKKDSKVTSTTVCQLRCIHTPVYLAKLKREFGKVPFVNVAWMKALQTIYFSTFPTRDLLIMIDIALVPEISRFCYMCLQTPLLKFITYCFCVNKLEL